MIESECVTEKFGCTLNTSFDVGFILLQERFYYIILIIIIIVNDILRNGRTMVFLPEH